MNSVSFSLYGSDRKYTWGALRNSELCSKIYPGWQMVVYHDQSVPIGVLGELKANGVMLIQWKHANKMVWRFMEHDRLNAGDRYLIRDTDSRLNIREAEAVQKWIDSGKLFHSIRDHPHHLRPMVGGCWGGTAGSMFGMGELLSKFRFSGNMYAQDEVFLSQRIWPLVRQHCFVQDAFNRHIHPDSEGFKPDGWRFVGEVFDERNLPRSFDWKMRASAVYA